MSKLKLLAFMLLFCLASCNSVYKDAKSYYDTQDYVRTVQIIVANSDVPSSPEKMALIKDSINSLDKAISNAQFDQRIALYKDLLNISKSTQNTAYQNASPLLSIRYQNINYLIADEYYKYGAYLFPETADQYKVQVAILTEGMKYYPFHKELNKSLGEAKKQYALTSAEENYTKAKHVLQDNDYRNACTYLDNVIQSYKNYGDYKDANKLFAKYDPIWRKQKANNDYDQATHNG